MEATLQNDLWNEQEGNDNNPIIYYCHICDGVANVDTVEYTTKGFRSLGTHYKGIHSKCFYKRMFEAHDWREDMKLVNAPEGWWQPVPIEDVTDENGNWTGWKHLSAINMRQKRLNEVVFGTVVEGERIFGREISAGIIKAEIEENMQSSFLDEIKREPIIEGVDWKTLIKQARRVYPKYGGKKMLQFLKDEYEAKFSKMTSMTVRMPSLATVERILAELKAEYGNTQSEPLVIGVLTETLDQAIAEEDGGLILECITLLKEKGIERNDYVKYLKRTGDGGKDYVKGNGKNNYRCNRTPTNQAVQFAY